jgi:thioredoxin reductase (NADPH)
MKEHTVGVIGAGPIGLELAVALKQTGIDYIQLDKGQVAQMIYNFPPRTRFFSSSERIAIAGIPIQTVDQQKCPREEYLAYIRSIVLHFNLKVNTYEEVMRVEKARDGFILKTRSSTGEGDYRVRFLVLATGGTSHPRSLGIPGEDLPHVSIKMEDPHKYFQRRVVIIGAKNSAVESALRCFHAAATSVSMVFRADQFSPQHVKYWLLPELLGRIERGEIGSYEGSEPLEIFPDRIRIKRRQVIELPADFIIKAIGFEADMSLFHQLGVTLSKEQEAVLHDEHMQTSIPNVYVLGTAVAGTQQKYRIFIENTHEHVERIIKDLCAKLSISSTWQLSRPEMVQHLEE